MKEKLLFHYFKHHLGCGIEWLSDNKNQWNDEISLHLKTIGASQLDFYIGDMTIDDIFSQVATIIEEHKLTDKTAYIEWLDQNEGFREIELSDHSRWTLRYVDQDTYIHLHPSRHSIHTIRVKANTLKTIMCTLLLQKETIYRFDINEINNYRVNYLSLSPIKENGDHEELKNIFTLFSEKLINE